MNILVTLDQNYLPPLRVLLCSLFLSNPGDHFDIYLVSDDITDAQLEGVRAFCRRFSSELHLIPVGKDWFSSAPTVRYYSRAMYYRLLAGVLLPQEMDRILYLDPDMLVINPIRPLYDTALGSSLYAACIHRGLVDLSSPVNKLRLSSYESEGYFNSGMLLMNLPQIRRSVTPKDVFRYVEKNRALLVLPDQDVLNGLYGDRITELDERLYNYNARKYREYLLASSGEADLDWVMQNTVILHYCGKKKPWHHASSGRFNALYKHYLQLSARL